MSRSNGGGMGWIALVIAVAAAFHFYRTSPGNSPIGTASSGGLKVLKVEKKRPTTAAIKGMAANGHVVAARRAALSADTPGRIIELHVQEGSRVEKGQLLARLFAEEYAAALKRAEADLLAAQASLRQADAAVIAQKAEVGRLIASLHASEASNRAEEAELVLAQLENDRMEKLAQRNAVDLSQRDKARSALSGGKAQYDQSTAMAGVAQSAVEHGKAELEIKKAECEVNQARVEVAKANVDHARATLMKTEIRAPFTGIVVLKDADVGEVVSPNVAGGASSRGSVVTMVDIDSLEVQAEVPETSLRAVRIGGPVRIFLDADPERPYEGKVDRIWPTANRQKATIEVRAVFAKRDDVLRPDMGVRVVFLPEDAVEEAPATAEPEMLVPGKSLVRRKGETGVFVVKDEKALFRPIKVGATRGSRIQVESGLQEGEKIVVDVPESLEDGDVVRAEEA